MSFDALQLKTDLQAEFSNTTAGKTASAAAQGVSNAIVDNYTADVGPILGVVGQIAFWDTTSSIDGDTGLIWSNSTKRLGVGTNPSYKLHISDTAQNSLYVSTTMDVNWGTIASFLAPSFSDAQSMQIRFGKSGPGGNYNCGEFHFYYHGTNDTRSNLGFGLYGVTPPLKVFGSGDVGVGIPNGGLPGAKLDVAGTGRFTGKLTLGGGSDPPYVLYNYETRQSIIDRVKREISPDKLNGAVHFYNGADDRMEIFTPSSGIFKDFLGNFLYAADPITETFVIKDNWYLDEDTGKLCNMPVPDQKPRWEIKSGYKLDPDTGVFWELDENQVPTIEVDKAQAIEEKSTTVS